MSRRSLVLRDPHHGLKRADGAATSPIAVYEAAVGLRRKRHCSVAEAEAGVMEFLSAARVRLDSIEPSAAYGALEAFSRYGKGTQHPAQFPAAHPQADADLTGGFRLSISPARLG